MQSVGVRIPRDIEPVPRHFFTVTRRLEVEVDHLFIRLGGLVCFEESDLGGGRWQAGQGEGDAADQRRPRGLGLRHQSRLIEPGQEEPVEFILSPRRIFHGGRRRLGRWFEGPVLLIRSPLFDPAANGLLLFVGQFLLG